MARHFEPSRIYRKDVTPPSAAAMGVQGPGWASLSAEPLSGRLVIEQVYDHQGNTGNATTPLLVLDMWEHAYYLQYRNEKAIWMEAFWNLVDWNDVEARPERVGRIDLLLD